MKTKRWNRIKRLFTALITVLLLDVLLLLLPVIRKPSDTKGSGRENISGAELLNEMPEGEDLPGSDSAINDAGEAVQPGSDLCIPSGGTGKETSVESSATVREDDSSAPAKDNSGFYTEPVSGDPGQPADEDGTVTLCLMGDLMCLAGQQYTAERGDGTHDYTDSFYLLRDTFAVCDFVIGNLETTLSESNPYSTAEREVNEQPNCNAPADYLASLKWAGITHLVTANNHSLDGGAVGVRETLAHLDEYSIPHTGTYREDYEGSRYMMLGKNGIRIAVLSFTELINQRALVTPPQLSRMIDSYSRADVGDRIAQARADGADFVIVYEHWGSENVHEVRSYQRQHAEEIAAAGADLIIGSHPHCLQETETIVTEDGRSVPCFYSLGNVVSSMTRDINHDTVFVQVTLQRQNAGDSAGIVAAASINLLPCHVLTYLDGHYRVITPVGYRTDDEKAAAELAAAKIRINAIFP